MSMKINGHISRSQHYKNMGITGSNSYHSQPTGTQAKTERQCNHHLFNKTYARLRKKLEERNTTPPSVSQMGPSETWALVAVAIKLFNESKSL